MGNKMNKVNRIQSYGTMIAGVKANVAATATIPVQGAATAQPAIVGALQGYIDAAAQTAVAKAAYEEAVAKQNAALTSANAAYLGVKAYALAEYVKQPTTLQSFGLEVPARKTPSPAVVTAATAKRKVTIAAKKADEAAAAAKQVTAATPAPAAGAAGSGTTKPAGA